MLSIQIPKPLVIAMLVAALIGFADSTYLTAQHLRGLVPPCGLTGSTCDTVLNSAYASVGPLPVAALGLLYYGAVVLLLVAYLDSYRRHLLHWTAWLVSAGMLGSLYFTFIQGFVLDAWCPYCLMSAFTTLVLFVCSVIIMRRD